MAQMSSSSPCHRPISTHSPIYYIISACGLELIWWWGNWICQNIGLLPSPPVGENPTMNKLFFLEHTCNNSMDMSFSIELKNINACI